MSATLLIVSRELRSRRAVLVAALFAGILTLAAPLLPWVEPGSAADARLAMALVFAAAFAGGTAVAHGATMVATDLKERRLGYYFARPLSGTAIWAGKLIAGLLLALGSGLLALLPSAAVARGQLTGWLEAGTVPFVVGGTLLLLGVAHLVAVAIASRSRLLALDLVALVTVSGAGALMLRRLVATGAIDLVVVVLGTLAVTALLLVLAAGWAQVAGGRCDPVRGHRLQSSVLWGGLGLTVSLLGAFTAFVTGASPASLRSVESVQAAGSGTWVAVQGPARWRGGYQPSFLVDTGSGRYLRLPGLGPWWLPVSLSQDGRRAVWLDADAYLDRPFAEVVTLDLTVPRSAPRPTAIFVDLQAFAWSALSPDGARLAVVADRQVTVYDLEDGRQVATALLDSPASSPRLAFVDPDRLRVELWRELEPRSDRGRGELIVGALHLDDGRFEITARLEVDLVRGWFRPVSLDTQRMVLYHRAGSGADLVLHDSWSGAPLATLLSSYREGPPRVLFLADGRIAVDASEAGTARLKVFDRDGRDLADRDLGPGQWVTPLSEVAPGRVLATVGSKATSDPAWRRARQGVVVDLESGAQHPLPSGWLPARGQHWPWWIPQKPQAGSLASRLLLNPEGGLEALDPETFDTRHLLGPR